MPRSRALFTAPIVLAVVIAGVFAIRSRDNGGDELNTTRSRACPPVARADVAATKPATPLSIDVLANDTDADGDPLVFQIIKTTGGDSTVDDGGTPTDASDDRILFTPANPAPETATVEYQAVDPDGGVDQATVTVAVNAEAALPQGQVSEPVTADADAAEGCGGPTTTDPDRTGVSTPPFTGSGTGTTVDRDARRSRRDRDRDGDERRRRTTRTTRRDSGDGDRATTTRPTSNTDPTQPRPTSPPPTQPPPTSPPPTDPPGPPPTDPAERCGPYPVDGSDEQQQQWEDCVRTG